jgi:hypothetical protein
MRAIQPAARGNINKYSRWEGSRWDEEIEPADFWTVFNEKSFIIRKQNCFLIFVSIDSQETPLPSFLVSLPKASTEGNKRILFLIILAIADWVIEKQAPWDCKGVLDSALTPWADMVNSCHRVGLQCRISLHLCTLTCFRT